MIYLDNAGTTKMLEEVLEEFNNSANNSFYNPSALYKNANSVNKHILECKDIIKKSLNFDNSNVIFTSGATESNNTIIRSFVRNKNKKYLFSIAEHPSVYNVAIDLRNNGYNIEFVNLNIDGKVDIEDFKNKMTKDVDFISIMHVNNETGAINDIKSLCAIAKKINPDVVFHSDGVQAYCKVKVDCNDLGIDAYTISAHKINGPKGVGGLVIKNGINLKPLLIGGGQENNLRSGTENTYGIFAFSKAVEILQSKLNYNMDRIKLYNKLVKECISYIPNTIIVSNDSSSPYIISTIFKNTRAESILNMLEDKGVIVGNGSACSSKKTDNRILSAMGFKKEEIQGNIRISFNILNTEKEIETLIEILPKIIKQYRENTKG